MVDNENETDSNIDRYMLTTVDNPYDPFTEYDDWFAFDARMNYNTPALLGRIAIVSDELSEPDQVSAIQEAIMSIAETNASGMHKKVKRKTP